MKQRNFLPKDRPKVTFIPEFVKINNKNLLIIKYIATIYLYLIGISICTVKIQRNS
jgi:hypothetical protein